MSSSPSHSSSSSPSPAVLLVHGGYHLPKAYDSFLHLLSLSKFTTRCPHLPTNADVRPPKATFHDDVAAVRAAISELISSGHSIIVLAHSWGGLVASESVTRDLYAETHRHDGTATGVVSLIYVSAWLIQPGTSLPMLFQKYGFKSDLKLDVDADRMATVKNAREAFYHDVESETAKELEGELVTHNFEEISTEGAKILTGAPWKDLKCAFVVCEQDRGIYPELQRAMVRDVVEAGARDMRIFELDAGHGPFWSVPQRVVEIVEEIWRSYLED